MTEQVTKKEVTADDVEEFSEYLVSVCGVKIDPKTGEIRNSSDEPITVETSSGHKPMIVYRELTKLKNHVILNIFSDKSEHNAQLRWFWNQKSFELATMLQLIIESAIQYKAGTMTDEHEYVRLSIASMCPQTERKLLENFQKIQSSELLELVYSKSNKTAQLQTRIFDEAYMKTLNIPTKQWNVIHKVFKHIFKVDDEKEFNSLFKFTSSLNSIPGCEAQLRVFHRCLQSMEKYYVAFFGGEGFKLDWFERNLQNIQTYYALTDWIAQPSSATAEIKKAEHVKPENPLDRPKSDTIVLNSPSSRSRNPLDPEPVIDPLLGGRPGRMPTTSFNTNYRSDYRSGDFGRYRSSGTISLR